MINYFDNLKQKSQYRYFYTFACVGFGLIGLTYLFRENLLQKNEFLDNLLGVMPNLAGSFATPYLLLFLFAAYRKNSDLLGRGRIFIFINLFTFATCILIEYLHLWLNIGGFHQEDLIASFIGMVISLLSFFIINKFIP
jgi:putative flippase GtrA